MTEAGRLLPWSTLMRFGLGTLRLPPQAFWAMTPRELAACAGLVGSAPMPTRADLDALMARFPDAPAAPWPDAAPRQEG